MIERFGTVLQFLQTHNLWFGEALRQGVVLGVTFGLLQWSDAQQHAVFQAISALVTAYAAKSTVSAVKAQQRIEQAEQRGIAIGVAQAESGVGRG